MKTDTQIMNEVAVSTGYLKPISEDDAKVLKSLLLEMYKDIAALCDKQGLVYMMGGGTCLGAVRHKGFIPWDDDLDLMMPRESYEELIACLRRGELGDNYEFDAPNPLEDCKNPFLKIYRKGTLDVEITSETAPGPKGIYIDIFAMDYAPQNSFKRKIKAYMSDFLQAVCSCVLYSEYPSGKYKEFMIQTTEGKKRYRQRMFLGKIFGVIPHKKWVWWFDQFNHSCKASPLMTIPTGRKHYMGECRPAKVYLPTILAEFEGLQVNVPNQVDKYLSSMYGNYMQIPTVEKRERHFIYKFKLPEK